jgi:hypothetical protein
LELLQNTQSPRMVTASQQSTQATGSKVSKPSHCYVATQIQCTLCIGL